MTLTKAQVAAIQKNWNTVETDLQGYGNKLFLRFLTANPGELHFFPKFGTQDVNKLVFDGEFNKQTTVVFEFLTQVVKHMGDLKAASDLLRERVRSHKAREIGMAQFETLLDLMPRFLEEEAHASGAVADSWRVAIACLMPAMRDEFKK